MTKELNNFTHCSKLDLIKMYKKSRRDVRRLSRQKVELKQQIEKMKCCSNCNHFNKEEDIEHCWNCERQLVNSLDNLKAEEIIKDEWEIKENE